MGDERHRKTGLPILGTPTERPTPELLELVAVADLQRIQDAFAFATGVASVITSPSGQPITQPSNFSRLCRDIIRATPKGLRNCMRSDALLGTPNPRGPTVRPCLSCGLWDAGASIYAGERHVANWLIGQVRNEQQDEAMVLAYAEDIEADLEAFRSAYAEVTVMSTERFQQVSEFLFLTANHISQLAYTNLMQQRTFAEQARHEALHRELQRKAHQSQKLEAIGQLAGGVAHDFNNLLTAILGNTSLLELALGQAGMEAELVLLAEITDAAERAARLTQQLLAFSRQRPVNPVALDINRHLRGMQPILRRLLPETVRVRVLTPVAPCVVLADPSQLDQIILNLAVNARDAMPDGGSLELRASTVEVDDLLASVHPGLTVGAHALIVVGDTGSGMPPDVQEHIFEPFYSTKPQHRGTGLGLSTVFGVVRQLNGDIAVQSEVGQGTYFRIYLPEIAAPTATPTGNEVAPPVGGDETILLCEDDDALRVLTSRILREAGYTVLVAESAEHALELFERHEGSIALLLTDVILPGQNGRQLAQELARRSATLRTLFVSGYTAEVFADGTAFSEIELLEKPFTRAALLRRVRATLDRGARDPGTT